MKSFLVRWRFMWSSPPAILTFLLFFSRYEAWVIYNFLSLCLAWVGGPGAVVISLSGRVLKSNWCLMTCCFPPIPLDGWVIPSFTPYGWLLIVHGQPLKWIRIWLLWPKYECFAGFPADENLSQWDDVKYLCSSIKRH